MSAGEGRKLGSKFTKLRQVVSETVLQTSRDLGTSVAVANALVGHHDVFRTDHPELIAADMLLKRRTLPKSDEMREAASDPHGDIEANPSVAYPVMWQQWMRTYTECSSSPD